MRLATFKDLCIDATDPSASGAFWASALGLQLHHRPNGTVCLTGSSKAHTVWINQVPEPKTVKHRIHLDVHGCSIEELQVIGASVIDDTSFRWKVMADPDRGEFCLFIGEERPQYRLYELVVDCVDHEALSMWWASTIGGERRADDRGFSYINEIPNVPFDAVSFVPVDEPKSAKNRVHIDLVAGVIDPLLDAGARLLRARDDEIEWDVLADPEGNEFCVFSNH
jgi:hypothetical protein